MKKNFKGYRNQSGGFVEFIVAIVISIVMLHLLGINIVSVLSKPAVKEFALYVKDILALVWHDLMNIFAFVKDIANSSGTATSTVVN